MTESSSTFRSNVGAVIADRSDRVLIFERAAIPGAWQFPQGGLRQGEDPKDAVLREILEETGLDAERLELIAVRPDWLAYELPDENRTDKTGRGQVQKWFLFRLVGDAEFELPAGEFSDHRWVDIDEAVALAVDFKRRTYGIVAGWVRANLAVPPTTLSDAGREYALAEFSHVTGSLLSNEEMGERRVVHFVTLIALLATAFGLTAEAFPMASDGETLGIGLGALGAATAAGLLTFVRILKRNLHTTELQGKAHNLRCALTMGDPLAATLNPFDAPKPREFGWGKAGLAETVAVLNSLLIGAAAALIAAHNDVATLVVVVLCVAAFVATAVGHQRGATRYYSDDR